MGLKDEIAASSVKLGTPGKLDKLLADLPPSDRDELIDALGDRGVSSGQIFRALRARDIEVSESALRTWCRHARQA